MLKLQKTIHVLCTLLLITRLNDYLLWERSIKGFPAKSLNMSHLNNYNWSITYSNMWVYGGNNKKNRFQLTCNSRLRAGRWWRRGGWGRGGRWNWLGSGWGGAADATRTTAQIRARWRRMEMMDHLSRPSWCTLIIGGGGGGGGGVGRYYRAFEFLLCGGRVNTSSSTLFLLVAKLYID